jgi:hypothetical protein
MIQTVAIVLGALIVLMLIAAALMPSTFRIHRTTRIAAPPDRIHPLLVDFRRWPAWSPWEDLDPELRRSYGGAERGKGATYAWEGNKKAGAGTMVITEDAPPIGVGIDLRFTRPFPAHNTTEFRLTPDGTSTDVTWALTGPQPYLMRLMTMFYGMDKLVGPDFEKGLARLKAEVERGS